MKIKKMIEINLNDEKTIVKAIDYNKKNNYKYIICDKFSDIGTPLLPWDSICYLLRNGYKIDCYNEKQPTFIHKDYKEEEVEE